MPLRRWIRSPRTPSNFFGYTFCHMNETMLTAPDGRDFFYRYDGPKKPKAAVLFVHGIHEHSGAFAPFFPEFVAEGWYVGALDYRGHGRSARTLGDPENLDAVLSEIGEARRAAKEAAGEVPFFLLGHSFGGNLVYLSAASNPEGITGIVSLSATAKIPDYVNPLTKAAASFIAAVAPALPLEPFAWREASSDPKVIEEIDNDPLQYTGKVRARMGKVLIDSWNRLPAALGQITGPVLAFHGGADVNCPPSDLDYLVSRLTSTKPEFALQAGLRHVLFKEPDGRGEEVRNKVRNWIRSRIT